MEIKTTEEIIYEYRDEEHVGGGHYALKVEEPKVKWVKIEDIIEYLKNNTYGFKDNGANNIDADELISVLTK